MITMQEMAQECGTDKAWHEYPKFYEPLFQAKRRLPVKLLEIGVDGGESLRLWHDWFYNPKTEIYGIDIQDKGLTLYPRTKLFITDATSPNAVFDISNATAPYDIIIEDASHYSKDQKKLLELWWPHLKPGGIWVTEDTHSGYHYPWNDKGEIPFVHSLGEWIDRVNENGAGHHGVPTQTDVEEIILRKSLVVIKKRQ
jgi:hypothetical protein